MGVRQYRTSVAMALHVNRNFSLRTVPIIARRASSRSASDAGAAPRRGLLDWLRAAFAMMFR